MVIGFGQSFKCGLPYYVTKVDVVLSVFWFSQFVDEVLYRIWGGPERNKGISDASSSLEQYCQVDR